MARYGHGPFVDQPLWMERGGSLYFYHADHQGSVLALTDSAGAIINSYDYDAFGRVLVASEAVENPYLYTGREYDPETGFYHYRARYYDPDTGRFLSADPIGFGGGDTNLYAYVFNSPANLVDPFGLSATESSGTGSIGARAAGGIAAVGRTLSCGFSIIANAFAAINTVISIEDATGGMVDGSIVETADALNPRSLFKPVTMVKATARRSIAWTKSQGAFLRKLAQKDKVSKGRSAEDLVQSIVTRAERKLGGTGPVAGTKKHAYAKTLMDRYQRRFGGDLRTEFSYRGGYEVQYGTRGSIRLDVWDPTTRKVYDYKFTQNPGHGVSPRQQNRMRKQGPTNMDMIVEINP